MKIEKHQLKVNGINVEVVRKAIKNFNIGVYPPNGRVRVSVPLAMSDEAVRLAVISKLGWIKRHQAKFAAQPRQSKLEMISGENHYYLGQRYRLRVVKQNGAAKILLRNQSILELQVQPGASLERRGRVLQEWYRQQLKQLIPPLLDKWQVNLGVKVADWGVKKMKTRWGSCNPKACRIWLNLELAKKPEKCLEYIVVHELAHLIERHHNDRFVAIMNQHLPQWRIFKQQLNSACASGTPRPGEVQAGWNGNSSP